MPERLPAHPRYFLEHLQALQRRLRDHVRACRDRADIETLSAVGEARDGDTLYAIDLHSETVLLEYCAAWGREMPLALVAEGIPANGWRLFPEGTPPAAARFCLIVDPIDGTRGLMYDKRSAWVLSGVAPNRGEATTMADIVVAMQSEIPTSRQYLVDRLWAVRGQGARAERENLLSGETTPFVPRPSRVPNLAHGFASIVKFFPGGRDLVARLEEELFERVVGAAPDGNPLVFDDQYMSSGGQLYELTVGHDRFIADLRPLALAAKYPAAAVQRLCCHPYDLCTELIAREAGVWVTDAWGEPVRVPLDIRADVAWVGYANAAIRAQVQPLLQQLMREMGWGA